MFNHFATLLANIKTSTPMLASPYAMPLDPSYVPAVLPQTLLDVRRALFGADPDQDMLMYRIRQFTLAVMASHLFPALAEFDTRLTDCQATPTKFLYTRGFSVSSLPATAAMDLSVLGNPASCDASGRMRQTFTISTSAGMASVTGPLNYSASVLASGTIPLAQTGVSVHIANPSQVSVFTVDFLAPAVRSFGQMVTDLQNGGDAILVALFGTSDEEPLASYRRAFESKLTVDQIAAAVLALAHQTEKLRFLRG